MATMTRKRTAGNTPALVRIKKTFNSKIYQIALRTMNEQGPEAVREYIRGFFNETAQHKADEIMDGTDA